MFDYHAVLPVRITAAYNRAYLPYRSGNTGTDSAPPTPKISHLPLSEVCLYIGWGIPSGKQHSYRDDMQQYATGMHHHEIVTDSSL
jgi:hypothetical protein